MLSLIAAQMCRCHLGLRMVMIKMNGHFFLVC